MNRGNDYRGNEAAQGLSVARLLQACMICADSWLTERVNVSLTTILGALLVEGSRLVAAGGRGRLRRAGGGAFIGTPETGWIDTQKVSHSYGAAK